MYITVYNSKFNDTYQFVQKKQKHVVICLSSEIHIQSNKIFHRQLSTETDFYMYLKII
jgi:hypothetical protein